MAKTKCQKCGKEVPDTAMQCVSCGARLYSDAEMLRPSKARKIKKVGLGWKILQLIGALITIIGIMEFISTDEPGFSPYIVLFGFCIFLLAWIFGRWRRDWKIDRITAHVEEAVALSAEAWTLFEDTYNSIPIGLFAEKDQTDETCDLLLLMWHQNFHAWEDSRNLSKHPRSWEIFKMRHQLTIKT